MTKSDIKAAAHRHQTRIPWVRRSVRLLPRSSHVGAGGSPGGHEDDGPLVAQALARDVLDRAAARAEGGGLPFCSCFRSSSAAAAPQQLRSRSVLPPKSFRVTSAVVPCYLRSSHRRNARITTAIGWVRTRRKVVAEARPPPRQRSRARVSRREPRDGRVRWRGE